MPKIYELDQHVADLIAAGEVVERPASVVKELMENAIDAGAGIITVEITAGGMTYIRVTDNGCGIAPDDVKTAFLRHATSKLKGAEGLEAIGTLGFRGEALAAIAAVSRIELLTREHGSDEGVCLSLEGGEVVDMSPAGCPEGTTIIVRDLFFNTPARLKFMKSDRAESSGIASAVLRSALAHPDVSVRFLRDGKAEYHTPGDSRVDSCIYSLFGREFAAGLIGAESSDETVSVKGYISAQAAARGNRSYQFFFVNGRPIRSITLQAALEQAYANTLPPGRFPSCALYITTRLSDVDVNVHPAKTEVKFVSDKQIFDGVYYAALGAVTQGGAGIDDAKDGAEYEMPDKEPWGMATGAANANRKPGEVKPSGGAFKTMRAEDYRKSYDTRGDKSAQIRVSEPIEPQFPGFNAGSPPISQPSYAPFRVIGEALKTYIIIEYNESIWFIDKHAAHERLHFDALKNGDFKPMSQALITPVICRQGHEDVSILLENAEILDGLGFSAECFGEDAVAVRRIPAEIDMADAESVLTDICAELRHSGTAEPARLDNIYRTIACKAAIKAGRSSTTRELESLAAKVMSGEASFCPHGRPVAFEVTKAALDKGFKRI